MVCGRGLSPFPLIGQLPSLLACKIIGHATPTLASQSFAVSSPLCIPYTSHPGVRLSMDPSLTTGSKGIYNPALSKHTAQLRLHSTCSQYQIYQYEMDFYVQYIASNISLHYLNPWRQRAASSPAAHREQGNSFWGSPAGIIHKGFNIKIFCSALALNNSCLASIFIGIGSRGVIRHYSEPWIN